MIKHQSPDIVSGLLKGFQGYLGIFRDIDAHSATHMHATRGKRGGLPCHFWKSQKESWFWKEGLDCVHLWVEFFIQNVVLKVSTSKISKMFPCGASFSCVFDKCLLKCPIFTPSALKKFWFCTCTHYSFCKTLHLKCLTVLWILLCLNNCSVIWRVTLYYVLLASDIQNSGIFITVFPGVSWHIQSYSALSEHIHAYWDNIKAYSGLIQAYSAPYVTKIS